MTIDLDPRFEIVLRQTADKKGISAEKLAEEWLQDRIVSLGDPSSSPPLHEWQELLRSAASDCGVSLSDEALRREEMYP